jgi:zinc protease
MRNLFLAFVAILTVGIVSPAQAKVIMETSPGGIAYARINIPDADTISIQMAWPSDWAFREDVNQAVPFVGADLIMQGGAEGYSPGEVAETFADIKAEGVLMPGPGRLFGSLSVSKEHLREALKIANAHLRAPALSENWLDRVKGGFAATIDELTAKPESAGYDALRWAILGDTPLRRSLSVDPPEQISAVTREDVQRWYRQTLLRNTAKIAIAGPVSAKEAGRAIDALFAGLPEGKAPEIVPPKPNFAPRRILLHIPDANVSSLNFAAPLPPTREGGDFEDIIAMMALGGDDQSALFDAVRTKLRASYGFIAGVAAYSSDVRFLLMSGQAETAKLGEAESVVRAAYADFRKSGPAGDLSERKTVFASGFESNKKNPAARALTALLAMLDGMDPATDPKAMLDKVTQASIQARLDKVYPPADGFVVLAVSPDANALPGACVIKTPAEAAGCR